MKKIIALISVFAVAFLFVGCFSQSTIEFEISFIVDGEIYATVSTDKNSIEMPVNPKKDDYEFDGWFWDEDIWGKPLTQNSLMDAPLSQAWRVYAKWTETKQEAEEKMSARFICDYSYSWIDSSFMPPLNEVRDYAPITVMQSKAELEAHLENKNISGYDLYYDCKDYYNPYYNLADDEKYDDAYFANNLLIVFYFFEPQGNIFNNTISINFEQDVNTINLEKWSDYTNVYGTHWHIIVGVDRASCLNLEFEYNVAERVYWDCEVNHKWDCLTTTQPTCTEKGMQTRTCQTCGYVETRELAALGHSWNDWSETVKPTLTNNGEETKICKRDSTHRETRTLYSQGNNGLVYAEINDGAEFEIMAYIGTGSSISIPVNFNGKPVTSIGAWSFYLEGTEGWKTDTTLKNIIFASGSKIKGIGDGAFYARGGIETFEFPSGLKRVGESAFSYCKNLKSVTFGKDSQLEYIGGSAFYNVEALKSIIVPKGVKQLDGSFYACMGLETVIFEEGSQLEFMDFAFRACYKLKSITIPKSVTYIGGSAISCCDELVSVTFEEGSQLKTIGYAAFEFNPKLKSITIPKGVTSIAEGAFAGSSSFDSIAVEEGNTAYKVETGCLIEISSDKLITGCNYSTIPNGIKSIGQNAFRRMTLGDVVIPDGATSIGMIAFTEATANSITIPASVISIGSQAFGSWTNSIKTIYFNGFSSQAEADAAWGTSWRNNCTAKIVYQEHEWSEWTIISQPTQTADGLQTRACSCCNKTEMRSTSGLDYVLNGNSYTVYKGLFTGKHLKIYETFNGKPVTAIGNDAFAFSKDIETIEIPSSITHIGNSAFYICSNVKTLTIPSSVKAIGNSAFSGWYALVSVAFEENSELETIESHAFSFNSRLKDIEIPASVTTIGSWAFGAGTDLSGFSIAKNSKLRSIGESAFSSSRLESIEIPAALTWLGNGAFESCTNLKTITVEAGNTVYKATNNCLIEIATDRLVACGAASTISIPDGVKTIGQGVFYYWWNFTSVEIPSSVTKIEFGAFSGCTNINSITLHSGIETIASSAFFAWENTQTINVKGFSSQAEADFAWGKDWRSGCNAQILYLG